MNSTTSNNEKNNSISNQNKKNNNISKNNDSNKPKLYSFYDIINKNKSAAKSESNKNNLNNNNNINQSYQDIRVLNTPRYKSNYSPESQDSNYISEPKYITMPVS